MLIDDKIAVDTEILANMAWINQKLSDVTTMRYIALKKVLCTGYAFAMIEYEMLFNGPQKICQQ